MKMILTAIALAGMFGAAQAMDGPMASDDSSSSGSAMSSPMSGGQMDHKTVKDKKSKMKKKNHMQGGAMQGPHSNMKKDDQDN